MTTTAVETRGLTIPRRFTMRDGRAVDPYQTCRWRNVRCRLVDDRTGETLFDEEIEAPEHWSDQAVTIVAQKYLKRAGVPGTGRETSVRQAIHRLAGCWTDWGRRHGYFAAEDDAQAFYDEVAYALIWQMFSPNSPQWFNTGLHWAYGIESTAQKFYYVDEDGELKETDRRYERPSIYACYISEIRDNLTEEGGIADFLAREMRIFQTGGGSGANFSSLRAEGEPLSGGGVSSGLMSFLRVFDRSAGAIKSGGTTRRAAKMVVVDVDHPEIEKFISWKVEEEKKVAALVAAGYDPDWRGEAYDTVSGQNSNNSVSVPDDFMRAVAEDRDWHLVGRVDGRIMKTVKARDLWRRIAEAAWACADPGLQFNTTMNAWHVAPHKGRIRATNPCSEYVMLDDTACNLASIRLTRFYDGDRFDVDGFCHLARLVTIVLEISIAMSKLPDRSIAVNTHNLRNLGLGYADLGGLLMLAGIPYDSDQGRAVAASVTSLLTATAYQTSAELAEAKGPYGYYHPEHHLRVVRNHRAATVGGSYEGVNIEPEPIRPERLPEWAKAVFDRAVRTWDRAVELGEAHGYRNAQVTLLAPTGTIALGMDCITTGVEPEFSLVKHKSLAGGGSITIVNPAVAPALRRLGYTDGQIEHITGWVAEHGDIVGAPGFDPAHLPVFATAVGRNAISPEGHLRMVAAVQPFLSGAASKTINLPNDATVDDILNIHTLAWELGVKCISVYRDGSKMSQVLEAAAGRDRQTAGQTRAKLEELLSNPPDGISPTAFYRELGLDGAPKFSLPAARVGRTWEIKVGGTKVFLRTGEYEDGTLGELFLDLAKEGATLRGVLSCFAMAVSHALQAGIPLRRLVNQFAHQTFEPRGVVERHQHVKMATSIIDAVFRILAAHYLGDYSLAQVKPGGDPAEEVGDFHAPARTQTTGETCGTCGGTAVRTGTCLTCLSCGSTSGGCS